MSPGDILNYVKDGAMYLVMGFGGYLLLLYFLEIGDSYPFHKMIRSQEELDEIIKEEAEKLGVSAGEVKGVLEENTHPLPCFPANQLVVGTNENDLRAFKKGDGYVISFIDGDWHTTRSAVKHEMYHIAKGHIEKKESIENPFKRALYYFLVAEPTAVLYSLFGIEL